MVRYDLNFLDNSTGIMPFVEGVNDLTGGLFFTVILGVVAILILIVYSSNNIGFNKVLLADGFITTLIGILLWASGLASFTVVMLPIILLFAGIMLSVFGGD